MRLKLLLFVVFYIFWVMAALFVVFGVFTAGQPAGYIPPLAIVVYLVVILIPTFLFNRWITGEPGWMKTTRADGTQAAATIVSANDAGFSLNRLRFVRLKLRVEPRNEDSFEVTQERPYSWFSMPAAGSTVQVKYDPNNRKHVVILSGAETLPTTSSRVNSAKLDPELQELMDMEAQTRGEGRTGTTNMSDELSNLARLHKNGDLSDAEFERAKKKLLG